MTNEFNILTKKALEELADDIRKAMSEKNLDNTGSASASLEVIDNALYGNDYIYFLDQGRKPGKFPPVNAIREWVKSKLGIEDKMVNSVAFVVGRSISENGTAIHRDKTKGIELDLLVNNMLAKLNDELLDHLIKAETWGTKR